MVDHKNKKRKIYSMKKIVLFNNNNIYIFFNFYKQLIFL